jgi:predicted ribosomally synthesized peptide with nif11-like leader
MSLKNVELFYERLSADQNFSAQIQNVANKEECSQIVQAAGYHFTPQEFEEYTAQILEDYSSEDLQSLNEQELAAVVGGIKGIIGRPGLMPLYGVVPPRYDLPLL